MHFSVGGRKDMHFSRGRKDMHFSVAAREGNEGLGRVAMTATRPANVTRQVCLALERFPYPGVSYARSQLGGVQDVQS